VLALPQQPLLLHAVEHLHAKIAGEMIVNRPARGAAPDPWARYARAGDRRARQAPQGPPHAGDIRVGEAIVAVATLLSCSIRLPASSFARCELAVCGVTPASCASSLAGQRAGRSSAPVSMLARRDRRPMRRSWRYRDLLS